MALVGSEGSFDHGREATGVAGRLRGHRQGRRTPRRSDRRRRLPRGEQAEIQRAKQLDLPEVCAPVVPVFYIEMDGTGVPVVKAETEGRAGKIEGPAGPHPRSETGLRVHPNHHRPGRPPDARRGLHHLHRRHRNRRRVRPPPLHRSLAARVEPGQEESGSRRRRGLDLESC